MPKVVADLSEFYTVDEFAGVLGKGVATIWRWIKRGKVNTIKIADRTLVPMSELKRLQSEKVNAKNA